MTSLTDVLHDLVRRGLALRIETNGTLFIYEPQRWTARGPDAAAQHRPAAGGLARLPGWAQDDGAQGASPWSPHAAAMPVPTPHGARLTAWPAAPAPATHRAGDPHTPCLPQGACSNVRGSCSGAAEDGATPRRRGRPAKPGGGGGSTPPPQAGATETATTAGKLIILPDRDGSFVPTGARWRGITWQDVPGHDKNIQKLNFSLLKRGMLRGHQCCARLHGEALKQRLREISERNRDNSQVRKEKDLRRRKRPKPP